VVLKTGLVAGGGRDAPRQMQVFEGRQPEVNTRQGSFRRRQQQLFTPTALKASKVPSAVSTRPFQPSSRRLVVAATAGAANAATESRVTATTALQVEESQAPSAGCKMAEHRV